MSPTELADVWNVPPAPKKTAAEAAACYTPQTGYATIVAPAGAVELGDVVDHTTGLMVVTAITRRTATWTLAGYDPAAPPAQYWALGGTAHGAPPTPPLARHVTGGGIRVRRPATSWQRLPGHTKKITSRSPVKSGCYTLVQGYSAACACGWTAERRTRDGAAAAHTEHRADIITAAARRAYGLDVIEHLEQQVGDVLPWRWDHGAQAQLHGLTTAQARDRLTPWAVALGAEIEHFIPGSFGHFADPDFLWVDSRAEDDAAARLDIRAYPVDQATGGALCTS